MATDIFPRVTVPGASASTKVSAKIVRVADSLTWDFALAGGTTLTFAATQTTPLLELTQSTATPEYFSATYATTGMSASNQYVDGLYDYLFYDTTNATPILLAASEFYCSGQNEAIVPSGAAPTAGQNAAATAAAILASPTHPIATDASGNVTATNGGGSVTVPANFAAMLISSDGHVAPDLSAIRQATSPTTLANITIPTVNTVNTVVNPVTGGSPGGSAVSTDLAVIGRQVGNSGVPLPFSMAGKTAGLMPTASASGASGSDFAGYFRSDGQGHIVDFVVTNSGSYAATPSLSLSGGSGTGLAIGSPTMGPGVNAGTIGVASVAVTAIGTGYGPTVTVSKNGAAAIAPSGLVWEMGGGDYSLGGPGLKADLGTLGPLTVYAATSGDSARAAFVVVPHNPIFGN